MQIIILGMHRSGTSALSRLLNLMGAYLGPDEAIMPPNANNPAGYWERVDVARINEKLLVSAGASWDRVADFAHEQIPAATLEEFSRQGSEIVGSLDEGGEPWVIKDPRMCLLLPAWRSLLRQPVCVHIYRRPSEVAQSLKARNGFPLPLGVALWEKYNREAFLASADLPRVLICHAQLIQDPMGLVRTLYEQLAGLGVRGLSIPDQATVEGFVDKNLQNAHGGRELDEQLLNKQQLELLDQLEDGSILVEEVSREISVGGFEALAGIPPVGQLERQIAELRRKLKENPESVEAVERRFTREIRLVVLERNSLAQQLTESERQIAKLRQKLAQEIKQSAVERNRLAQELAASERRVVRMMDRFASIDRSLGRLLESWRWRLGNTAVDAVKRVLLQRPQCLPLENIQNQMGMLFAEQKVTRPEVETGRGEAVAGEADGKAGVVRGGGNGSSRGLADIGQRVIRRLPDRLQPAAYNLARQVRSISNTKVSQFSSVQSGTLSGDEFETFEEFERWQLVNSSWIAPPYPRSFGRVLGMFAWHHRVYAERYSKQVSGDLVSVIMPTYNRADVLPRAIASVLEQSYEHWELLIVDDGSTDSTSGVVSGFEDPRIRYIRLDANGGASRARNAGLAEARGQYIAYLDSDNRWEPDFLLIMRGVLAERSEAKSAYCGQRIWMMRSPEKPEEVEDRGIRYAPFNRAMLENRNYIDLNSMMHKAELVDRFGPFKTDLYRFVDWELMLRYTSEVGAIAVPCLLSHYYDKAARNQITYSASSDNAMAILDGVLQERLIALRDVSSGEMELPDGPLFSNMGQRKEPLKDRHVAVVIPNYESLNCLRMAVASLYAHTSRDEFELIIVDNQSGEDTREYLRQLEDVGAARVIYNDGNYGFSYAVNQGIELAGPAADIVLLNNDAIVTEGWLGGLQEVLERVDDVGLIAPRQMLLPFTKTMEVHVPRCKLDREVDVTLSAHHRNILNPRLDEVRGYVELNFAPFFAVYIPRGTLAEAGLLDVENGPHYTSDRIYCDVVRAGLGKRIVYTPHSKIYHLLQQSTAHLKQSNREAYKAMFVENNWARIQSITKKPRSSASGMQPNGKVRERE